MSHHKYTTQGFILGSLPIGESNLQLLIYTKNLGMVRAFAVSSREIHSKLRFGLKQYSFSELNLIQAKSGWKITSARELYNLYEDIRGNNEKVIIIAHISALLARLINGEEKNESLFALLESGLEYLKESEFSREELRNFEAILILALLANLGYVGHDDAFDAFIRRPAWSKELLMEMDKIRSSVILEINKSLKSSQL